MKNVCPGSSRSKVDNAFYIYNHKIAIQRIGVNKKCHAIRRIQNYPAANSVNHPLRNQILTVKKLNYKLTYYFVVYDAQV